MKRLGMAHTIGACALALLAADRTGLAQKPSAPPTVPGAGTATGNTGTGGINGNNNPSSLGTNTNNNNQGGFNQTRPVFLAGSVLFDDGTPANSDIRIERVCGGNSRLETHTDTKGRFSFQVGGELGNNVADADASSDTFSRPGSASSNRLGNTNGLGGFNGGSSGRGSSSLMGCELRAAYPGYISESVDLSMHRSMDDSRVGTIVLHRLANVKGTTISLTTAQAPKSAQKDYEKGTQLAAKDKFEEAEQRFTKAVTVYPKFAEAWFALGEVQQRLNEMDAARKSFLAAVEADTRYVSPYNRLALLSAQQGKWEDAAKFSQQATDLNPVEFPSSFWYNALANYNLHNNAEAEKSARALVKLDSRHHYPDAETMLAEFSGNRGELAEAEAHLRAYLAEAPDAKNVDQVKHELARVEEARTAQAKSATAPAAH